MLGGDDGFTLLLCAAPDFAEQARSDAREAVLLTTTFDTPHAWLSLTRASGASGKLCGAFEPGRTGQS